MNFLDQSEEDREFLKLFQSVSGQKASHPSKGVWEEVYVESVHFQNIWEEHQMLSKLQRINQKISSQQDLDSLLILIMDTAIELTSAERGFLILTEENRWNYKIQRNIDKETLQDPQFKISHSVVEKVLQEGKTLLTTNAKEDERFSFFTSVQNLRLVSILCAPFRIKGKILGAVYIDNRLQVGAFEEKHLQILDAFSTQAAIAIENARLYKKLEEYYQKKKELGLEDDHLFEDY